MLQENKSNEIDGFLFDIYNVEELAYTPLEKVGDDINGIPPIEKGEVEKKKEKKKPKKEEEELLF